jgi:uroporphyrinogen decarboxylase
MDTKWLKANYRGRLSFWGGVDTHWVLPRGTPADVKAETKRRLEDLMPGGGYVLNSVHNIQPDVPPENIVAMFEAGLEYGYY